MPTKKRQPPVPIPPRLLAHLRRWAKMRIVTDHFVEWSGGAVKSVKTAFQSAVRLANLPGNVTPQTLSHRCDLAHAGRRGSRPASRSTKNTAQLVMARSSEALEQYPI